MAGFYSFSKYAMTTGTEGVATNASFTGPWIPVVDSQSVGFQVIMTGTSAPVGTWGADVTNDENAPQVADANLSPGSTALTLTSDMTAQNPSGNSANINYLFQFDPSPRAKYMRFKYARTSGGSASQLLKIGVATWGGRS